MASQVSISLIKALGRGREWAIIKEECCWFLEGLDLGETSFIARFVLFLMFFIMEDMDLDMEVRRSEAEDEEWIGGRAPWADTERERALEEVVPSGFESEAPRFDSRLILRTLRRIKEYQ